MGARFFPEVLPGVDDVVELLMIPPELHVLWILKDNLLLGYKYHPNRECLENIAKDFDLPGWECRIIKYAPVAGEPIR